MILWLLSLMMQAFANPCTETPFILVPTEDNAAICIKHYPAPGPPVLIAHGISSNHKFWDLNEEYSLALYLSQKGFDVYNMDFRGHGNAVFDINGKRQKMKRQRRESIKKMVRKVRLRNYSE